MNAMDGLLANPAVQSALIPLVCGVIAALLLSRAGTLWQGLAVTAGFLAAVMVITGLQFQPLTSTRKIILCSLLFPVIGLLMDFGGQNLIRRATLLAIMLAAAAVWVSWPVIGRSEIMEAAIVVAKVGIFAAWMGGSIVWFSRDRSHQQGGMLIALGTGVGASAILAATALYGQLSFSIAAATGGLLVVLLLRKTSENFGTLGVYSGVTPLALLGGAATVYAEMPLTSLICLFFVPVFAAIPLYRGANGWLRASIATVLGLLPAMPAIWIAWKVAGPVPL